MERVNEVLKLLICLVLSLFVLSLGSLFTNTNVLVWYAKLNKPSFAPPGWLFDPIWSVLYLIIPISAFLVWRKNGGSKPVRNGLILCAGQMVFNLLWWFFFFALRSPVLGLIDIAILWIFIFHTILKFSRISKPASMLLIPYILWISFLVVLNFSILMLNS